MLKQLYLIAIFFVAGFSLCFSQTKMPSFFSDNMVLQQNEDVAIWGSDEPGKIIDIHASWGVDKKIKTKENGKWHANIPTKEASFKNHEITIKGSSTITLHNVLIGEVWFGSGQSNMEMSMGGFKNAPVNNGEELINTSENNHIRLFNTERGASLSPEDDVVGSWEVTNPETVRSFSAIGYLFGRKLFEELQVPIGIIESSWGGTPIECWLPGTVVQKHPEINVPDTISQDQNRQKRPTFLYNAMINPFKDYTIKGFLWYQGEANRRNASFYKDYMISLVNSWRNQWHNSSLPFYFVEIAPFSYQNNKDTKAIKANLVREAQRLAANEIPNTGMVVTTDVGKCNQIHPPEKNVIAKRLANWALTKQYNFKGIAYRSPEYNSIKIKDDKAILTFRFFGEKETNLSFDNNRTLENFEIAGADHIFHKAQVKINKDQTLTVSSDKVKNPVAVRYGFVDCLEGSLFSNEGLPVSPFRTDNWIE